MTDITIKPMDEHRYAATVREGDLTTDHVVRVTDDFRDALALPDADDEQIVRESIGFLLEREKSTELYEEFELDLLIDQFPDDFLDELRTRLA